MDIKRFSAKIYNTDNSEEYIIRCYDEGIENMIDYLQNLKLFKTGYENVTFSLESNELTPIQCLDKRKSFMGVFRGNKIIKNIASSSNSIICHVPMILGSKFIPKDMKYNELKGSFIIKGSMYTVNNWELQDRNNVITSFRKQFITSFTSYNYSNHISSKMEIEISKENENVIIISVGKKNPITDKRATANIISFIMFCDLVKHMDVFISKEGKLDELKKKHEESGDFFSDVMEILDYDKQKRMEDILGNIMDKIPENDKTSLYIMKTYEEYSSVEFDENISTICRDFGYFKEFDQTMKNYKKIKSGDIRSFIKFLHKKVKDVYMPHLKSSDDQSRYFILADMIYQLSCEKIKDIDDMVNKTFETAGFSLWRVFARGIKNFKRKMKSSDDVFNALSKLFVDNFSTGIWYTENTNKSMTMIQSGRRGASQYVESTDDKARYTLSRISVNSKTDAVAKGVLGRLYHASQSPFICGSNITEGKRCGQTKAYAVGTRVSLNISDNGIRIFLDIFKNPNGEFNVFIETEFICKANNDIIDQFIAYRRAGKYIPKMANIYQEKEGMRRIIIKTCPNRPLFPFYVLGEDGFPLFTSRSFKNATFDQFVKEGYIEFIDAYEMTMVEKYGIDPDVPYKGYKYVAMHPAHMLSEFIDINSLLTQYDPPQRVTFLGAMTKAIAIREDGKSTGLRKTDYAYKSGGQVPIIKNIFSDSAKFTGATALTIVTAEIDTTEDGIVISDSFARRCGLIFYTNKEITTSRVSSSVLENIKGGKEKLKLMYEQKGMSDDGIIKEGEEVYKGRILAYNIISEEINGETVINIKTEEYRDDKVGVVHKVVRETEGISSGIMGTSKYNEYIIQIKHVYSQADTGNKLTTSHGQKGEISKIVPDDKMPFDKISGRRVDVIKGPASQINRLTMGELHELKVGFAFPMGITYTIDELIKEYYKKAQDFYIPLIHLRPSQIFPNNKKSTEQVIEFLKKWDVIIDDEFGDIDENKIEILKYDEMDNSAKYILFSSLTDNQKKILGGRLYRNIELHDGHIKRDVMSDVLTRVPIASFDPANDIILKAEKKIAKMGYAKGATIHNPETNSDIENVMIGNLYYYMLKQTARGKLHVSDIANFNPITGENSRGKKKNGGLKLGIQEMAMLIRLRVDEFIDEKRETSGVLIEVPFCKDCKMKAINKGGKFYCVNCTQTQDCCSGESIFKKGSYVCPKCERVSFVVKKITYAFSMVIDYFAPMGIGIGIDL